MCARRIDTRELCKHQSGRRQIGRTGHIVHIARPHERVNVRLVRLGSHGVTQKYHRIHLTLGQACANLQAHFAA